MRFKLFTTVEKMRIFALLWIVAPCRIVGQCFSNWGPKVVNKVRELSRFYSFIFTLIILMLNIYFFAFK